ncbi:SdiA-regulated domain-containing protein [Pseudomonas sp. F1_0610]|uniref:SdiA-regulated domain-containing protein n=1 Tax=Pseudomonas sp. F1_0610 TaxID=3114284 RepID=UPI0039C0F7AE
MRSANSPWALITFLIVFILAILTVVLQWDKQVMLWWQEHHTSLEERQRSIWLPNYEVAIEAKVIAKIGEEETSGLSWNDQSNTLFTVTGQKTQIAEMSLTGETLRVIQLEGFGDLEAIEVLDDGYVAVINERNGQLKIFKLPTEDQTVHLKDVEIVEIGIGDGGNKGIEGMAWDYKNKVLWVAKERDPKGLFTVDIKSRPVKVTQVASKGIFMKDFSAMEVDPRTGHLIVLSDQSQMLMEVSPEGKPVSYMKLTLGANGLASTIDQAEGVAMDDKGNIFMVAEPNLFYWFATPESAAAVGK